MLWTDADFVTAADLLTLDPELSEIAAAENIVLSDVIRRGIEDAGRFLENKLINFSTFRSSGELSANHLAAVLNTGGQATQRRRVALEQVVVSGRNESYWSDVKAWVANRCLRVLYRTAMNRASNDRYEHKYDRFTALEQLELWPAVKRSGVPVVTRPLYAPEAVQGFEPGTFAVSAVNGSGTLDETREVVVTYVGSAYLSKSSRGNNESHPSQAHQVALVAGKVIQVDVTNLNPPTDSVSAEMLARANVVPVKAIGWNVYVGVVGGPYYLQNASPIAIATKTITLNGDPASSGYVSGLGQHAESFLTIMDLSQRG